MPSSRLAYDMISTAEFTRPTDTNAYTIGDIISNDTAAGAAMQFGSQQGLLTFVSLLKSTNATNMTPFKLALYSADPGAVLDNAAWTLTYANRASYITTVSLAASAVVGAIAGAELTPTQPISLPPVMNIYGVLIAGAGVAMGNAETISVRLHTR